VLPPGEVLRRAELRFVNGAVVLYILGAGDFLGTHEGITLVAVAEAVAKLKRYDFEGRYDSARTYPGHVYFVPDDTMISAAAQKLGIASAADLFGGVVPYAFMKTKAITHELVDIEAERPTGWSLTFAARIREVVLPGYTVFSARAARVAATRLWAHGAIRVKHPLASGGRGQSLAASLSELEAILEAVSASDLARHGLVLETNLGEARTLSVGQVALDGLHLTLSYHGAQRVTTDNEGRSAYGGSDLVCVRGGWGALGRLSLSAGVREAIAQARRYDDATREYPGFMASRRNYDVGQGVDGTGQPRSGVFESSWRAGGASSAEMAALTAFTQDSTLTVVHASSVEEYGEGLEAPRDATVHFEGVDTKAGPTIRYTVITRMLRDPV
jgi:hypothetical protein